LTLAGSELNSQWETKRFQSLGLGYRNGDLLMRGPARLGLVTTVNQELRSNPQATKQLTARSKLDWPLTRRFILVQRGALMLQTGGDPNINPGLLQSLGGAETIRGYNENHKRVANFAFMQTELRMRTGAGSSLFFFTDWGTFGTRRKEGEMLGVGMGVTLTTRRRPLSIHLAGQPGTTLGNMLVHISFETESLWIDR
jgi:hemolysin activation/secretion protein